MITHTHEWKLVRKVHVSPTYEVKTVEGKKVLARYNNIKIFSNRPTCTEE